MKKKKDEFSAYLDTLEAVRDAGVKAPGKGTELYKALISSVKPYVEKEILDGINTINHLLKTGLYITNFYDPWYSTGYYLNSAINRIYYNKDVLEKYFYKEDYPECYNIIPEYKEYPDDLIIGLKEYYMEVENNYRKYVDSTEYSFINKNLDAYIKAKYGVTRSTSRITERDVYLSRVNFLGRIVETVKDAGGIDAVEVGHDGQLKLEIRLACSPSSKRCYENFMKIASEMKTYGFAENAHKQDQFIEKIKLFSLPMGQLSIFDYGIA